MTPFSVVIPSASEKNLVHCIRALLAHEPNPSPQQIIVVWDGEPWQGKNVQVGLPPVTWVQGEQPFIFSRNVNAGVRLAGGDCFVLQDDALLETEGGFSALADRAKAFPEVGLWSAAICGTVGNPDQTYHEPTPVAPRVTPDTLMFICVYIPWSTWQRVGELDERFVGYGYDDNDYCKRVREAGLDLAVFDGCVVEHESQPSSYRSRPDYEPLLAQNKRLFYEKYAARERLSFAMIAYNEERFIGDCLRSVQDVVSEMVVYADARTTDRTEVIARSFGAFVPDSDWRDRADVNGFAHMRNGAIEGCFTRDAVLMLDADERLTQAGRAMLPKCLGYMPEQVDGWGFTLEDRTLDDRPFAEVGTVPRLFMRHPDLRFEGYCHEDLAWSDGRQGRWGHVTDVPAIVHYGHDLTVQAERGKHERHVALLRRWLDEHPKDGRRWLSLAEELYELHRFGDAKRAAGRAQATGYRFPAHRQARIQQIRLAASQPDPLPNEPWSPDDPPSPSRRRY